MDDRRIRPSVWLVAAAALAALVFVMLRGGGPAEAPKTDAAAVAPAGDLASRSRRPHEDRSAARAPTAAAEEVPYVEGMVWGEIDLREAKALMPDNIYWTQGAPTKDPAILEERAQEKRRLNDEYGRVLAGDASEDEVRAYYDQRKRVAGDYLQFAEFMARRYRNSENKQFIGLLELAVKIQADKLAGMAAELEEALARAREREKVREDWRRQKEEFGADGGIPPEQGRLE